MSKINSFTVVFFVLSVFNPITLNHAQVDWNYDLGLYGWFAGMEGTVGVAN